MMKKKDSQKGFAMLFTVLIVSIILSISIGISNITFKQNILSSIAKDSQIAFFTADTGIECGLVHDLNTSQFAKGVTSVPSTISCGDMTFDYDASASFQDNFVYVEDVSNQNNPCRVIIFDKTDASINSVKSRGYNICKQTPRQVERALEARFQNSNPESIIREKLTEILALGEVYKTSSSSYNGICNSVGDSNVLAIQSAMDYIKSTGAGVKCHTYNNSSTHSKDWGVAVHLDNNVYTAGPMEGVLKLGPDITAAQTWSGAKNFCQTSGGNLVGVSALRALYFASGYSNPMPTFTTMNYFWTNTETTPTTAVYIHSNGQNIHNSYKTANIPFKCGMPF